MSFTPEDLFNEIRKYVPNLKITYKIDSRQNIADSWPMAFDDTNARHDWNWNPKYDLERLVKKMFDELNRLNGEKNKLNVKI